ncbi:hypothetical protein KY290_021320 [Solanum tuberosum]|uniref:Uncharacterized protein n=1 Tax=Solanum tuberosum TaxID=4113 RepID=A0ABQ7V189_SOLTU|nr:hypothetical protein KY289_020474 [Solanum tuberosum]KAH0693144.1 hypothetical protein KY285_020241 [Solanum tuberosum]KAH0757827.1 hypothetical protein KY290_021320 [Solanum tuberosum]
MHCEGTILKIKKRKVDSGMSIHVEEDSAIAMVLRPFESLAIELKMVKEIVMNLPQGLGESSSGPVSYSPQHEFDGYLSYQRKQRGHIASLKKAYASLAK